MSVFPLLLLLGLLPARVAGFAPSSLGRFGASPTELQFARRVAGFAPSNLLLLLGPARVAGFAPSSLGRFGASPTELQYARHHDDAPPFSDAESPQARARRMEMARELQKAFYREREPETPSSSLLHAPKPNGSSNYPYGHSAIRNLPTITSNDGIQSADGTAPSALLPGYQFVWNVHNAGLCHMFHSILSGPAPWYFAHVYLPSASSDDEEESQIDNVQSYYDIQQHLKSDAPLYATLLRITDRRFQDDDGRIVLAVQAIDRVRVNNVASLPGASLSTDVQLSPEEELMKMHFDKALMSSASYLSSRSTDAENEALTCPSAVRGAARAAAAADTFRIRRFEYLPIFLEEKPKRPAASSVRSKPSDSKASRMIKDAIRKQDEQKEDATEYISVVQLVNYDAFAFSSLGKTHSVTSQALKTYWEQLAKESPGIVVEEDLFGSSAAGASSSFFLPEPTTTLPAHVSVEAVERTEMQVWLAIDEMMRLLSIAATATVPLPSQLLGLLPKRKDWPHEFMLEDYAKSLATSGSTIGTAFKSPFVRVDTIASNDPTSYSSLRRASRLSYAIWLLLDGLAMANAQPQPPPRHVVLRMETIEERLSAAKEILEGINLVLKKMIPENRKDTDEKK
ncbi:hypothetical protein ACHAXT_000297 [Thalassiosira profunda]